MYIAPNSILKLLVNVPLDSDYVNTINFDSVSEQTAYFASKYKYNFDNYSYLKEQQKIRVGVKADNIYECNYLMFQNTSFGTKWFYAFINKVEYINNEMSEITFEIDVMQTWCFDYTLRTSFVEREHSLTDVIGENLVPENLELGDYQYKDLGLTSLFSLYQIVIASTFDKDMNDAVGGMYGGVYSGLCYNVFTSYSSANAFIEQATEANKSEGIVSVFMLPIAFCADYQETMPEVFDIERDKHYTDIDGYVPKNKKLFTSPYNTLYVTNNEGGATNYPFEYFSTEKCTFHVSGAMCCTPECMIVPLYFKGVAENYNEKLIVGNFPQCAYSVDTFKAYVAQNATRMSYEAVTGLAQTAVGGVAMYATGGLLGSSQVVGGLSQTAGMLATLADKSTLPPHAKGVNSSIINMANEIKGFQFYYAYVRKEFAEIIDNYFSMYGYATHKMKVPNRSSRPHWNYVKTLNANIIGRVPSDDLKKIRNIYDRGVTFWKNGNEVGNYSLDNSI
jgi:hypothetical protein